jgi:hypothetical protein
MGLRDTLRLVGAVTSEEFVPEPKAYNTQRPIQGAAQRIDLRKPNTIVSTEEQAFTAWQREAWEYYDAIGEVKYAFQLVGAVMSRLRIAAALILDEDAAPVSVSSHIADRDAQNAEERVEFARKELSPPDSFTDEVLTYARKLVRDLSSGHGGMSGLLRDFAVNVSIPGECYLVNHQNRWQIYSTSEIIIRTTDKKAFLRKFRTSTNGVGAGPSRYDEELPASTFIGRIWRPHPRYTYEPDSSMLALRDACSELLTLQQMIRGVARSRMNAGILFVPDGLSVAASNLTEDGDDDDIFEQELYDSMTAPISDEAAASAVVPMIVRGPGELSANLKHIQFSREADQWLITRADRVLESIMQGIDVPKDLVTGLANVKYCVDTSTEVLTKSGWKRHNELVVGEDVYTLNTTTGMAEWQPALAVNVFDNQADEPMMLASSRDHNSLSTPDHRWLAKSADGTFTEVRTADITKPISIPISAQSAHLPNEAKYTDDFVELVAWMQTEGHYQIPRPAKNSKGAVWDDKMTARGGGIAQSRTANPAHWTRINQLMTRMFGAASESMTPSQAGGHALRSDKSPQWRALTGGFWFNSMVVSVLREAFDESSDEPGAIAKKIVSKDFILSLTRAQLELFVQVSVWGDGCGDEYGQYGQNNEARQEAFELACHLLGKPISRRSNGEHGWWDCRRKVRDTATIWPIDNKHSWVAQYEGQVWCPTTQNGTWFARRGKHFFFTGNSNAVVIDESLYKSHIEPLALLFCDAVTTMYLRPAMKAQFPELSDDDLMSLCVWYDPSEVVSRPDPANSANDGYDRFALSGSAWRRAHGFSNTDAPTEAELALRLALDKATVPPEIATALLKAAVPHVFEAERQKARESLPVPFPESAQQILDGTDTQGLADSLVEPMDNEAVSNQALPNQALPNPGAVQ